MKTMLIFFAGGLNPPEILARVTLFLLIIMILGSIYAIRTQCKKESGNYKGNKKIIPWFHALDDPFNLKWFSTSGHISKEKLKGYDYNGKDIRKENIPVRSWDIDDDDKFNLSVTFKIINQ